MPQIVDTTLVAPNPFFKVATFNFNEYLSIYKSSKDITARYIVLEPEYNNLDLSKIEFDPLEFFSKRFLYDLTCDSVKVIFDCSYEGSSINFPYLKLFLKSYQHRSFNLSNFYYLTGDAEEQHLNVYHINSLDSLFKDVYVNKTIPSNKDYYFTCLTRKPRYWRSKLIYLIKNDVYLKNKSLCSHPIITSSNQFSNHTGFDVEEDLVNFFIKHSPMQVSDKDPLSNIMKFDSVISHLPDVFSKVLFDVTLETFQEDHKYITEKTFKPMLNLTPMLIWGAPNINTTGLSSLGFKTYEDWFDLSFDKEKNTAKRLQMLIQEIKRICNMLDDMSTTQRIMWQQKNLSLLTHNRDLILNMLPKNVSEINRLVTDLDKA